MELKNYGIVEYWNSWNIDIHGIMELKNYGIEELWNCGILEFMEY